MKIDFFIAGFQKAATTKLKEMISYNSHVSMHSLEEMTYFIDEEYKGINYDFISEYFAPVLAESHRGAKSASMAISDGALKRLKKHNENCKIILVLRNPVKRAYSAYWYCRRLGWENEQDFNKAIYKTPELYSDGIARRNCDYLGQSYYAQHIRTVQKYFKPESIKVYILEEDFKDMEKLNLDLCDFLNIPYEKLNSSEQEAIVNSAAMPRFVFITQLIRRKSYLSSWIKKMMPVGIVSKVKNLKEKMVKLNEVSFDQPIIDEQVFMELEAYFKDKNKELEVLIGREIQKW